MKMLYIEDRVVGFPSIAYIYLFVSLIGCDNGSCIEEDIILHL